MNRAMLDRWEANRGERVAILSFWVWLCKDVDYEELLDVNIDQQLDEYHGINQKQLETERRALLDSCRRESK